MKIDFIYVCKCRRKKSGSLHTDIFVLKYTFFAYEQQSSLGKVEELEKEKRDYYFVMSIFLNVLK